MSEYRTVIVELWSGTRVLARLGPTVVLTDAQVTRRLRGLGLRDSIPDTAEARLERLTGYPTDADLRALERVYTPDNDGVRPVARVLESVTTPGLSLGAPGSVPR